MTDLHTSAPEHSSREGDAKRPAPGVSTLKNRPTPVADSFREDMGYVPISVLADYEQRLGHAVEFVEDLPCRAKTDEFGTRYFAEFNCGLASCGRCLTLSLLKRETPRALGKEPTP